MKKNNQGSILIWSLFLMFFVVSAFLYMSIQIKTHISTQDILLRQAEENYLFGSGFETTLPFQASLWFEFDEVNNFTLQAGSGSILFYRTTGESGIIFSEDSSSISSHNLEIIGLGGKNKVIISDFDTETFKFPYQYYKKYITIDNIQLVQEFGKK